MMAAQSDEQWEWLFVTEGIKAWADLISSGLTPHTSFPLHAQGHPTRPPSKAISLAALNSVR